MTGLMLSGWTSHPCEWDTPLQAWEILQPTPLIIQLHYWVKSNFLQSLISLFPPKIYSRITSRVWQGSHQESLFYDIQIVATLTGLFSETQTVNLKSNGDHEAWVVIEINCWCPECHLQGLILLSTSKRDLSWGLENVRLVSPSVESERVPPSDVDSDQTGLDGLEDGYRLPVRESLHWQAVDGQYFVSWRKEAILLLFYS